MVTTAQRWISEIDASEKDCATWMKRCHAIIRRYRDERDRSYDNPTNRRYAILWSNVETIGPAIYARPPQPVVTRRFNDQDPIAKAAGEVLERALSYGVEANDFDLFMENARLDYLLCGRGQAWVRYEPTMETVEPASNADTDEESPIDDPEAAPYERVTYEEWKIDHVLWDDFLTNPCRTWPEVRWVGRNVRMTRAELVKRFTNPSEIPGKTVGEAVPLDWAPKGFRQKDPDTDEIVKKASIYEIWDKVTRKAYWVSKSWPQVLDERDDPLKLKDFYPCPRPLFATLASDSLIPTPDYYLYQDQAEELNQLTARIGRLIDALRLNGVYAGEEKDNVQRLLDTTNENRLIPVENWAGLQDKGGMKGIIEWMPLDMIAGTLKACFEARDQIMQDIYQITGLSDIIRGASDPRETAKAVQTKSQWGSIRVRDRQKEVERFARDIIRLGAEVIGNFFAKETLEAMTGEKMPTMEEKMAAQQQIQMLMQQAQMASQPQPGQPPQPPQEPDIPEELQLAASSPTWDEVMALLRDNATRCFRIDVETDSTIEPDREQEQAKAIEFMNIVGTTIASVGPAVAAQPAIAPFLGEVFMYVVRRLDIGRGMEEITEKAFQELAAMPPQQEGAAPAGDPNALQIAQMEMQTEQIKQNGALEIERLKAQMQQAEMPYRMAELRMKGFALQNDPDPQGSA